MSDSLLLKRPCILAAGHFFGSNFSYKLAEAQLAERENAPLNSCASRYNICGERAGWHVADEKHASKKRYDAWLADMGYELPVVNGAGA